MKKIILAGMLISQSIFGANLDVTKDVHDGRTSYRIDMQQNEVVHIDGDTFSVVLKEIVDFRCVPPRACFTGDFWEGAISVNLNVTQDDYNENITVMYQDERPAVVELPEYKLIISNIMKYAEDRFQIILTAVPQY